MAERVSIRLAIDAGTPQTEAVQMDFIDFSDFNAYDTWIAGILCWQFRVGASGSGFAGNFIAVSGSTYWPTK